MKKSSRGNTAVVSFRQWTNKGYAAFNSLKKVMRIAVLFNSYSMLLLPSGMAAVTGEDSIVMKLHIDDVSVTGRRVPGVFSQTDRIISIIPRSEIREFPVQNVQDILEYLPNVDVRQRGANGVQADLSIRGGTVDQALILLNGVNFNDPQTGHYSLNLPLEPDAVKRIEILEGSASRVFGPNAFTGAVNFITSPDDSLWLRMSVSGGDFAYRKGLFSINLPAGKTSHFISAGKTASDGYIKATDFNTLNVFYHGDLKLKSIDFDWQFGYSDKEYGAANFYGVRYSNQFEHTKTLFSSLRAKTGKRLVFTPVFYWRRNADHYILNRDNPEAYQNFHRTDVAGLNLSQYITWALGRSAWGADVRYEHLLSTNLGTPRKNPVEVAGESGRYYDKGDTRRNHSLYFEHNIDTDILSVSGGFMINHFSSLNNWGFCPGVDFSFKLNREYRLYGSVSSALRLPTFTDLYYQGPENVGNRDLKPEKNISWESGIKAFKPGWKGHIAYFGRSGKDMIDWIWLDEDDKWHTLNHTKLYTHGLTMASDFSPMAWFGLKFPVKKVSVSYTYSSQIKPGADYISYYALDYLNHKFDIGLSHSIIKNVSAVWKLSWQDRYGAYLKYNKETNTTASESYTPFWLLDSKIMWKKGCFEVFAEANNILNISYYDLGNIVQAPRWFKTGITFSL